MEIRAEYGKADYWESRYAANHEFGSSADGHFDWYHRYQGLEAVLGPHLTAEKKILNVGSGSSRVPMEMYELGFTNQTNIDVSPTVTKLMQEAYEEKYPSMKYLQMDALSMDFENQFFDVVIDKAMLDSVLCADGGFQKATEVIREIYRVLKHDGVYFIVSNQKSEFRTPLLFPEEFQWDVSVEKVLKPGKQEPQPPAEGEQQPDPSEFYFYVYICKKREEPPAEAPAAS